MKAWQTKISDFSDIIYSTSKNVLKMMWLSRNTKVLDSFSPTNGKLTPALCDQVTNYCLGSLTFSLFSATITNDIPTIRGKNRLHTITHVHNIAHVNCCTCTYLFPKQTEYQHQWEKKFWSNYIKYIWE